MNDNKNKSYTSKRKALCTKALGYWEKNLKISKSIEQKADAIQQDMTTIKEAQQDIMTGIESMPEKTATKVVKGMELPLKDVEGNLMDSNKEQADRLERNIPMVITEQVAAQLAAYFGPVPHPGSSASSSASAVDKKLKQATRLRKAAENAAEKKALVLD